MRPEEDEVVGQSFPEELVVAEDIAEDVVVEAPRNQGSALEAAIEVRKRRSRSKRICCCPYKE